MITIPIYQVDAFAEEVFRGNPAAVCLPGELLEEELMQAIAAENNLSETAFVFQGPRGYSIRWFTPSAEVALCGHATLAAAYVLWEKQGYSGEEIQFQTAESGVLTVRKAGEGVYQLDLPIDRFTQAAIPVNCLQALGRIPEAAFAGSTDLMLVYPAQEDIENIVPDFGELSSWHYRGIIATAPGRQDDFVSRFFAPAVGVDEDPVTGSAHCTLLPYWTAVHGKEWLRSRQLSQRGGALTGRVSGERVLLNGRAVLYLSGSIYI